MAAPPHSLVTSAPNSLLLSPPLLPPCVLVILTATQMSHPKTLATLFLTDLTLVIFFPQLQPLPPQLHQSSTYIVTANESLGHRLSLSFHPILKFHNAPPSSPLTLSLFYHFFQPPWPLPCWKGLTKRQSRLNPMLHLSHPPPKQLEKIIPLIGLTLSLYHRSPVDLQC